MAGLLVGLVPGQGEGLVPGHGEGLVAEPVGGLVAEPVAGLVRCDVFHGPIIGESVPPGNRE